MPTTYDYISRNKTMSIALIIGFVLFIALLGWVIGEWTNYGIGGFILAIVIAIGMSVGGYYAGDKIALMVSRAKGPIEKKNNAYLYNMVENLCIASGTPMPKLYIMEDPTINAFATGRDPKHASIAVTTGAMEQLENEELEGVLAHELSHIRNFDVRYMMLILVLVNVVMLLARWMFYSGSFGGRRRDSQNNAGGIFALVGIVLLILSPIIAQLVRFAVSRKRESLADASGALLTRYPEGLARALEKIKSVNRQPLQSANEATQHLFFANPFGSTGRRIATLFSTHPPIDERIQALREMAA
jgi:heat shock protein HtpX